MIKKGEGVFGARLTALGILRVDIPLGGCIDWWFFDGASFAYLAIWCYL